MLPPMNDGYMWWLVILGIAIGVAVVWLTAIRLPRRDDDQTAAERVAEARWISATIERDGGIAPQALAHRLNSAHLEPAGRFRVDRAHDAYRNPEDFTSP